MNPIGVLFPEERMTQSFEQLTAKRPVRVWTHVFDKLDGTPPIDMEELEAISPASRDELGPLPDDPALCGRAYRIRLRPVIAPHDHEHHEIVLVLGGTAVYRTALYETVLRKGTVSIVAVGKVHAFEEIDGLCIVNCAYLSEWLFQDIRELMAVDGLIPHFLATGLYSHPDNPWVPQHVLDEEAFREVVHELRDIGKEWERETPSLPYMRRCLEKLIIVLSRAFAQNDHFKSYPPLHPEIQGALGEIEDCIMSGDAFSVSKLAATAHMSGDYFSRVFKSTTGWSPMDYYQRRRIEQAAWLLLNACSSITEIACSLGFSDPAHFSRMFRRYQGMSPRDYRKRYTGD